MKQAHLEAVDQSNHSRMVAQVKQAIMELRASNESISFYSVANKAQVARSTLYRCDDLRRLVKAAREESASQPVIMGMEANSPDLLTRIAELTEALSNERELTSKLEHQLQSLYPCRYAFVVSNDTA